MRALLPLLLAALLACGAHADGGGRGKGNMRWARTLVGARLKSQQMRLDALGDRLDRLVEAVRGRSSEESVAETVDDLENRVQSLEGNDCSKEYMMSCGFHSGQCVAELLVCDGSKDCDNGEDESENTCINPVPPGKTWSGHVTWTGCVSRGEDKVTIVITSNHRNEMLPSRLDITAVISLTHDVGGEHETVSFSTAGTYSYGKRRVVLQPSPDSDMRIGVVCDDAGINIARCRFLNESDLHECGHSVLGTKVHPLREN